MANRIPRKWLEARAELIGLKIAYYNPGDGGRYSVGPAGEYFADEYFYGSAKEVSIFISGWLVSLDKRKQSLNDVIVEELREMIEKENNNG